MPRVLFIGCDPPLRVAANSLRTVSSTNTVVLAAIGSGFEPTSQGNEELHGLALDAGIERGNVRGSVYLLMVIQYSESQYPDLNKVGT
jgi:hypothetical protein